MCLYLFYQEIFSSFRFFFPSRYVDAERLGIWGWSFGGFLSATVLAESEDLFKTAVSVAPVTDWRYYDTAYAERYMRIPSKEVRDDASS